MRWMKSIRIALLVLILSLIAVQMTASEEIVWGKMPWEKGGIDSGEYYIEVTDVSLGGSESEIMFGGSRIWVLITIYKNDSVVWRGVFANSTSQTFPDLMDFVYDADKGEYRFTIDIFPPSAPSDHPLYNPDNPAYHPDHPRYESLIETCGNNGSKPVRIIDGTNLIELCVKDLVIGSNPSIQYTVDIFTHIIDISGMSFEEWINNTFFMTKSASRYVYVRDKAFTEIKIANISMLDRVEIADSIMDEFVVDPDRDLCWNYSLDTYRYSTKPLVPGSYTLPAAEATVWYRGYRINLTSNTPDISVEGPYVMVTKTAELNGDVVNVTVSVINTGEYVTMLYVLDSIPEGAKLIEGVLNYTNPNYIEAPRAVLEPGECRYVNKYSIQINTSVVLPRAVVHYQTSKKVDVTRSYRPAATFEIEKYINPKFYAAISRSEKIEITYENDSGQEDGVELEESQEPVGVVNSSESTESTELAESIEFTESTESTESTEPVESTSSEEDVPDKADETQEKGGVVQKIKSMPGFGAMSALAGILAGCVILIRRNHDLI